MPRKTLVDLQLETLREWRKYRENPIHYAEKIKQVARRLDPKAKVLIFGSYAENRARPDSDIDVLVITKLAADAKSRIKLRIQIAKEIGVSTPFEIHIITPIEYEKWYSHFIKRIIEI